jgi:cell division protein FtsL
VRRVEATNGWKLWAVAAVSLVAILVGARHVWTEQRGLFLKRAIFLELSKNRDLVQQRDTLERDVADLTAAPRMAMRAREILGMRPPKPDELIVVRPATEDR